MLPTRFFRVDGCLVETDESLLLLPFPVFVVVMSPPSHGFVKFDEPTAQKGHLL